LAVYEVINLHICKLISFHVGKTPQKLSFGAKPVSKRQLGLKGLKTRRPKGLKGLKGLKTLGALFFLVEQIMIELISDAPDAQYVLWICRI
jgi:hypothetical protein